MSTVAYFFPSSTNGVAAKFDSIPSSFLLLKITSPLLALSGEISHHLSSAVGTAFHQTFGYFEVDAHEIKRNIEQINKNRKKITRGKKVKVQGYKKAIITLKKGQSIDLTTGI